MKEKRVRNNERKDKVEKDTNVITIIGEEGEEIQLFVLEQTTLNGRNYLIAADSEDDEEAVAYILKESANDPDSDEVAYEFVEDEDEIEAVAIVFDELLEDCELLSDE